MEKNLTKALCSILVASIKSEVVPEIVASVTREIVPAVDRIVEDRIAVLTSGINDGVASQTNAIDQRLSLLCDALDRLEASVSALQSSAQSSCSTQSADAVNNNNTIDNNDAQLHVGEATIDTSDSNPIDNDDADDNNDDDNSDDPIAALLSSMGFESSPTQSDQPKSNTPTPNPNPTPIADTDDAALAFSALSTIRRRTAIRQYMLENGVSSAETRDPSYLTIDNAIALRGAVAFWNFCLESVL